MIATKLHKQINDYYQTKTIAAKSIQQAYKKHITNKETRKEIEQYISNFKRIKHAVRELQTFVRLRQRNHAAARVLQTLGRSFLSQRKRQLKRLPKPLLTTQSAKPYKVAKKSAQQQPKTFATHSSANRLNYHK